MSNPLLQACIDEFRIAAVVYFVGREVSGSKFGSTPDLSILRKLRPWIAGWCDANQAAALAAAADRHLANHRHDSPAVSVAKAAKQHEITLTEHGSIMQRAQNLIDVVNEKFNDARNAGQFAAFNASYKEARARGEAVEPHGAIVLRYKRHLLRLMAAEIIGKPLRDQTKLPRRAVIKKRTSRPSIATTRRQAQS